MPAYRFFFLMIRRPPRSTLFPYTTMGALHEGHLSLIHRARQDCNPVIASIFVNPTQFGPKEDFTKYPRSFESDVAQLSAAGVDSLFAPDAAEIYPNGFHTYVNVEGLSERLEGRSRPGHFRGEIGRASCRERV